MQRLLIGLVCIVLLIPTLLVSAQDDGGSTTLAYGDKVTGEITNRVFESLYTFEGKAGDLVMVRMQRTNTNDDLDPYLYLTTLDNTILAQSDDDYFTYNALVLVKLEADGTYQIVATRSGGRGGTSTGSFELTLESLRGMQLGVVAEGQVVNDYEQGQFEFFVPTTSGTYTLTYKQVRGDFYPGLTVLRLSNEEYSYTETIADLSAFHMQSLSVAMDFEADSIYMIAVGQNYYDYEASSAATALYTLQIDAVTK